jgi:hypothetical protein
MDTFEEYFEFCKNENIKFTVIVGSGYHKEALGDHSLKSWDACPEWQKQSSVNGVIFKLKNLQATPEDMHISWMKDKQTAGWKYGLVKDEVKKEHPCMVEYSQLPVEQRAKDHIFASIVKSLAHLTYTFN